jgi:hypothetical protein
VPADSTVYVGLSAGEAERLLAATSRADVDFERDVQPWLGDRAAYFALGSADAYGLVFDAEDEDAAEAFGDKVTAAGPLRASAVIDGHLVLAPTREVLRAANAAAGGQALADSTRLDVAGENEDGAPDLLIASDRARTLVAGLELYEVLPDDLPIPVEPMLEDGRLTARVWRERNRVDVSGLPPVAAAPSLADLPGGAWLAFAAADLGGALAALGSTREEYARLEAWVALDLDRDVLPHVGRGTLFVQGDRPRDRGAQLRAEVGDEPVLRRVAAATARTLRRRPRTGVEWYADESSVQLTAWRKGLSPYRTHLLGGFNLAVDDGRLTLELGAPTGGVADDLGETRRYRDAERSLGGAPTLMADLSKLGSSGWLAARRDGETLRIVTR